MRVVLSICILAFSGYFWPSLYKHGSSTASFLACIMLGLVAVLLLCWFSPRIESARGCPLKASQLWSLVLYSVPVVALEVALATTYWAYIGRAPFHLGALSMLPEVLLLAW